MVNWSPSREKRYQRNLVCPHHIIYLSEWFLESTYISIGDPITFLLKEQDGEIILSNKLEDTCATYPSWSYSDDTNNKSAVNWTKRTIILSMSIERWHTFLLKKNSISLSNYLLQVPDWSVAWNFCLFCFTFCMCLYQLLQRCSTQGENDTITTGRLIFCSNLN